MLPLLEPLPPARPEIAEATPTACGCAHHGRSLPSSPMPESAETLRSASERSRLLAEASEARRRLNQCRDWASVVAGAARDAVHFNVVDAGQPYASVHRSLPPFYYDPDAHEPHALSTHPHSCCTSPRSPVRELATPQDVKPFARPVKTEADAQPQPHPVPNGPRSPSRETFHHYRREPTVPEYAYARVEVLDEKPLRLNVEPHIELSALRKRRRSPHAPVSEAASPAPPAQRIKAEPTSPVLPPKRRTSSVPAPSFSSNAHASSSRRPAFFIDRRTDRSSRLRLPGTTDTNVAEPVAGTSRPTASPAPSIQRRQSRRSVSAQLGLGQSLSEAAPPTLPASPSQSSALGLHQPERPEPQSQAMISVLSTQSAPAAPDSNSSSGDEHRAPDQDSPKRVCDPLPSIGGLWCARDSRGSRSRQSTPKLKGKFKGPRI